MGNRLRRFVTSCWPDAIIMIGLGLFILVFPDPEGKITAAASCPDISASSWL